jgi:hypothetical protein
MFSRLNNLYWFIRCTRKKSLKRRYYRYVSIEKKRLILSGVDWEYLRLYCRTLSNRQNEHAERKLQSYLDNYLDDR